MNRQSYNSLPEWYSALAVPSYFFIVTKKGTPQVPISWRTFILSSKHIVHDTYIHAPNLALGKGAVK